MAKSKVMTKVPGGSKEVHVGSIDQIAKRKKAARGRRISRTKIPDVPKTTSLEGVGSPIVKKKKVLTEKELVWDSGLKIVSPPILIDVPKSIADVIRSIEKQVDIGVEFSIYVNADISDIECIKVSEEYYVPKQVVSGGSVDYNEVPDKRFNAVIHKHPRGITSFSSTDDEYINSNFRVSILWCNGGFVDATVNYDAGAGVKLQLEGCVVVDDDKYLPEVDVGNISVLRQNVVKHVSLSPQHYYPGSHVPGTEQSAFDNYAEQYGYFRDQECHRMGYYECEKCDYMDHGEDDDVSFEKLTGGSLRGGME